LSRFCTITTAVVLIALTLPGAAIAAGADMGNRMEEAHLTPSIIQSPVFDDRPDQDPSPFVNVTHDTDARFRFQLATRAVLFSIAGLVIPVLWDAVSSATLESHFRYYR